MRLRALDEQAHHHAGLVAPAGVGKTEAKRLGLLGRRQRRGGRGLGACMLAGGRAGQSKPGGVRAGVLPADAGQPACGKAAAPPAGRRGGGGHALGHVDGLDLPAGRQQAPAHRLAQALERRGDGGALVGALRRTQARLQLAAEQAQSLVRPGGEALPQGRGLQRQLGAHVARRKAPEPLGHRRHPGVGTPLGGGGVVLPAQAAGKAAPPLQHRLRVGRAGLHQPLPARLACGGRQAGGRQPRRAPQPRLGAIGRQRTGHPRILPELGQGDGVAFGLQHLAQRLEPAAGRRVIVFGRRVGQQPPAHLGRGAVGRKRRLGGPQRQPAALRGRKIGKGVGAGQRHRRPATGGAPALEQLPGQAPDRHLVGRRAADGPLARHPRLARGPRGQLGGGSARPQPGRLGVGRQARRLGKGLGRRPRRVRQRVLALPHQRLAQHRRVSGGPGGAYQMAELRSVVAHARERAAQGGALRPGVFGQLGQLAPQRRLLVCRQHAGRLLQHLPRGLRVGRQPPQYLGAAQRVLALRGRKQRLGPVRLAERPPPHGGFLAQPRGPPGRLARVLGGQGRGVGLRLGRAELLGDRVTQCRPAGAAVQASHFGECGLRVVHLPARQRHLGQLQPDGGPLVLRRGLRLRPQRVDELGLTARTEKRPGPQAQPAGVVLRAEGIGQREGARGEGVGGVNVRGGAVARLVGRRSAACGRGRLLQRRFGPHCGRIAPHPRRLAPRLFGRAAVDQCRRQPPRRLLRTQ